MATTLTSDLEREQLISEIEQMCAENDAAMGLDPGAPPTTKAPRVMLAFLMGLSVGLSLGAAGVAIAAWVITAQ